MTSGRGYRRRKLRRELKDKIKNAKLGLFCETRWVEKDTTLLNFNEMYEPVLDCLDAIGSVESCWDAKTLTIAYGLMKSITDHTFIVIFHTVLHFFRYMIGLRIKLQGSILEIVQGYDMIRHITSILKKARQDEIDWEQIFSSATEMSEKA